MVRYKQRIANIFSNHLAYKHRSKICHNEHCASELFVERRLLRNVTCFHKSTLSIAISIHYIVLLICIMISSAISGETSRDQSIVHLRSIQPHAQQQQNNLTAHNRDHLNSQSSFSPTKVLNNQKLSSSLSTFATTSEAIVSVHTLKRINLSSELNIDLFQDLTTFSPTDSELSRIAVLSNLRPPLHKNQTNNQNRRSLKTIKEDVNNITTQQTKSTFAPLLPKLSTYRPMLARDDGNKLTESQSQNNNSNSSTSSFQSEKSEQEYSLTAKITIFTLLLLLIIATTVGNVFVIAAIFLDKNLQSSQNYLVLSLAVADLTVALLVMPPCMVYEVYQKWVLGSEMCVAWNLLDVFSCTASILHLLAIALDRYWSVSSLHYSQGRSLKRMMYLIATIWLAAAVVSMPPLLGLKDPEYEQRLQNGKCLLSQHVGYQIFATLITFYGPSVFILFLYWKIYQVARKRIRNKPGNQASSERKSRALSSKEDKTDSFKKQTNINTISSRITMASTVDVPTSSTQNTSSELSKLDDCTVTGKARQQSNNKEKQKKDSKHEQHPAGQSKEVQKQRKDSNKQEQIKESKSSTTCQCEIIPKSHHRVYDSSMMCKKHGRKVHKLTGSTSATNVECDRCEEVTNEASISNVHHHNHHHKQASINNKDRIADKLIADKPQHSIETELIHDKQTASQNQSHPPAGRQVRDEEPIKKSRRFQTKYRYIDEDDRDELNDGQLKDASTLNDRNNNIKCDNECRDKLNRLDNAHSLAEADKLTMRIELNKQLESNLINNFAMNLENLKDEDRLANSLGGSNLDNKLANNNKIANSLIKQTNDVHQMKDLSNDLRQTNLEIETQLNSTVTNKNTSAEQRRQIDKSSSIQAITTTATAIKTKNHSNIMAKKERKTAKILAIITGIFMICWFPFFVNALLMALLPKTYQVSNALTSLFLCLGYFNSSLNPLVYTIFSPDFRNAFKKLLTRCKGS